MTLITNIRTLFLAAKQTRVLKASIRTALVVGIILNTINQWGAIWGNADFSMAHFLMNFVVPFLVSSYSAARNDVARGFNPND
jgi:hypothetical protein